MAWTKGEQNPFDGMALPVLQAIWAASIDNEGNGEVLLLERITWDSSRPLILGWVSPEEFLVESGDSEVLLEDVTTYIRKIGIRSQAVEAIYEGEYAKTAFDPQTQTLAFVRSAAGDANGMFMISPSDSQFRQIDRGEWNGIWWISGTDWFYVENWFYTESQSDHVSAFFTEQGERLDLFSFENTVPIPSPDGKYLAFIGRDMEGQGGVRIYNIQGIWLKQILPDLDTEDVDFFWKPDSSGFWFINHSYEYFEGVIEYSFQGDFVIQWDEELRNVEHYAHPVWMGNP